MPVSQHLLLADNLVPAIANPLRLDPTRTTLIRKKFIAELNRRFRKLRGHVREFLVELDALGLKDKKSLVPFKSLVVRNVQPREFEFRTDAGKLTAFNEWLQQQMQADILSPSPGTPAGQPWTTEYIESAYKRGLLNAYGSSPEGKTMEGQGVGEQTREQFLRSAFGAPESRAKVQFLATRSYEQLKGVTAAMGSEMNRILAQGMVDGKGPAEIAREMSARIEGLTRTRALLIARTEVIAAHAEGQLDAFGKLGVDELGIKAEWSTAGDDRVCGECAANEGAVFTVDEARGMIPLHPGCRCSWIPSEPEKKKSRR